MCCVYTHIVFTAYYIKILFILYNCYLYYWYQLTSQSETTQIHIQGKILKKAHTF